MSKHKPIRLSALLLEDRIVPTVNLVQDINLLPEMAGSNPASSIVIDGVLYFTAATRTTGVELWRSDGTSSGTKLVHDINNGSGSSNPSNLTNVGGKLFFSAYDGILHGAEPWISDGTSSGTRFLRNIFPGTQTTPREFADVNGTLFFVASNSTQGFELWSSDGTFEGTKLVRDIAIGTADSNPTELTNVNGVLFFAATGSGGRRLWQSDGTEAGTIEIPGTLADSGFHPTNLVNYGGTLYFWVDDGIHGRALWKSDGTAAGSELVFDLRPGKDNPQPGNMTVAGNTLFFSANNGSIGIELWKSDGTSSGTALVRDINPGAIGSSLANFVYVDGSLFFTASDGVHGAELWRSDGTSTGTMLVRDIRPGATGSAPGNLTAVGNSLFFTANDGSLDAELWRTDGTSSGTVLVRDVQAGKLGSSPAALANLGGSLLFAADDGLIGRELWISNGTATGTSVVRDIWAGTLNSGPRSFTIVNDIAFFSADDGVHGRELWRTDGTASGTMLVRDIRPGNLASMDITPENLHNLNGTLIFSACVGSLGQELWQSDGTSAGTELLLDIRPGWAGSDPSNFTRLGDFIYFTANDGFSGRELWRTDGTVSGTILVRDIWPGINGSLIRDMTVVDDRIFFTANTGSGQHLWVSDGTSAGTNLVREIGTGSGANPDPTPRFLTNVNGVLYFTVDDGIHGRELWRSDGTSSGTQLVKDIRPGHVSSDIRYLTNVNGTLFFRASHPILPVSTLWKSDGTDEGTELVLQNDSFSSLTSVINELTNVNGILYFRGIESFNFQTQSGHELYRSDGTESGTYLVRDILPGPASSNVEGLQNLNGLLVFSARDGSNGRELWRSDGTPEGTFLLAEAAPGPGGGDPGFVPSVPSQGLPGQPVVLGNSLIFAANTDDSGRELFRYTKPGLPRVVAVTSPNPNGVYATGETIDITLRFDEPVRLTGGDMVVTLDTGAELVVEPFVGSSVTVQYTVQMNHTSPGLTITQFSLASAATLKDWLNLNVELSLPAGANLGDTSNLIINPLPPTTTTGVIVNLGAVQRSRLTSITLNFDQPIDVQALNVPGAITLERTSGGPPAIVQTGAVGPNGLITLVPASGMVTSVTLLFSNANGAPESGGVQYGSLADGRWQLSIPWLSYTSILGDSNLRRLFGDHDNNGTVDGIDFVAFGSVFGGPGPEFDYDNNGTVDGLDFAQFGTRFGVSL